MIDGGENMNFLEERIAKDGVVKEGHVLKVDSFLNHQMDIELFHVPVVFAKKSQSINLDGEMYVAEVESFTHKCKNQVIVSKKFLSPDDHVLIIDDFLANGYALQGLISIVHDAGATVEGIGIAIEKGFQIGGQVIRNLGYHLESLAIVDSMDPATGTVNFRSQE